MYEDVVLTARVGADEWPIIGATLEDYLARQAGLCKVIRQKDGSMDLRLWIYSVDEGRVMVEMSKLARAAGVAAPRFKSKRSCL